MLEEEEAKKKRQIILKTSICKTHLYIQIYNKHILYIIDFPFRFASSFIDLITKFLAKHKRDLPSIEL